MIRPKFLILCSAVLRSVCVSAFQKQLMPRTYSHSFHVRPASLLVEFLSSSEPKATIWQGFDANKATSGFSQLTENFEKDFDELSIGFNSLKVFVKSNPDLTFGLTAILLFVLFAVRNSIDEYTSAGPTSLPPPSLSELQAELNKKEAERLKAVAELESALRELSETRAALEAAEASNIEVKSRRLQQMTATELNDLLLSVGMVPRSLTKLELLVEVENYFAQELVGQKSSIPPLL